MKKPASENLRKIQAAESRRKVLLTSMAVFAEKGYEGASVRDIVERIGCSVNAISNHFGSKEKLAAAIVMELKGTIVAPVANTAEDILSDYAWRVCVKRFVRQVVGLFAAQEEPNCYFPALYRHESANLHAKKVTLHEEIMKPIFRQLEGLVALGVATREPMEVRLWTLFLWNNIIAYALKHPEVIAADVPAGIDPQLFRETTIDFMVDNCIRTLHFVPPATDAET